MLGLPLIPSADESISGLKNASGPSEPLRICGEIQPIAPHLPGVYVHVSGSASGPSEPHLPDTARLRRPLRTTETGLNHFCPGWTKLVYSTEPARFTSDGENRTRTTNAEKQESAKTMKRPRGKPPKERHERRKHQTGDNHRHTQKDANRPRDTSEPKTRTTGPDPDGVRCL